MAFIKLLKKACKNCSEASIKVYERNIKRLHKLVSEKELPDTGKWLSSKDLMKKYKALDLKVRRHLSLAAVKACRAYGTKDDDWVKAMTNDSDAYQKQREKRELTDEEKAKIPKKGYASLKKLTSEYARRNKRSWATKSKSGLYKYGLQFLLKLMSEVPLRNTAASLKIKDSGANYIVVPKKGNGKLVFRQHKASKKIGTKEIPISRALTMAARKFLKYRAEIVEHDNLLSSANGSPLTKSALGKALHRITSDLLGKAFGSRLIRILAARDNAEVLEKAKALSNAMLHGNEQQTLQYAKKDATKEK